MVRFLTAAALLALCAPVFTSPAAAEQASTGGAAPVGGPVNDATVRLGIFYLTPTLSIERIGIDTNAIPSSAEPKSDFTATMAPAATVWVPFRRRALLTTNFDLGLVYYEVFKDQRSVNPGVRSRAELYARRLTFLVEAGRSSVHTPPNFEINDRVRYVTSNVGGGVRVQMLRGLSAEVSTYHQTVGFADDEAFRGVILQDTLDRSERGLRVRVEERLTSLTTVGVILETRNTRFDRTNDRDEEGYRVAATINLAARALISGSAEIGFRQQESNNPLVPAFRGLVARVAVTNRLGGSLQTDVGWDRDTHYSFDVVPSYYVSNTFTAIVRRQVAGRFDATVGGVRNRSTYRTAADVVFGGGGRDLTTSYTAEVGYRAGRQLRLGLSATKIERTSTRTDARGYGATRAGLFLNYGF